MYYLSTYRMPLWLDMLGCYGAHVRGKPFIQPKISPPIHRDNISKPLPDKGDQTRLEHSIGVFLQILSM